MSEYLHQPSANPNGLGIVLTHGAGSNANATLLVKTAEAFSSAGFFVLRYDLPFRQHKPFGPPSPSAAAQDRAGLREAVSRLKQFAPRVCLGGHSYGGRQASILASEEPSLAAALLLLSYPLHPPKKAAQLRTAHFPQLQTPALFVSGAKDEFGTVAELSTALTLIPARHNLRIVDGAGHDLKKGVFDLQQLIVLPFHNLLAEQQE